MENYSRPVILEWLPFWMILEATWLITHSSAPVGWGGESGENLRTHGSG